MTDYTTGYTGGDPEGHRELARKELDTPVAISTTLQLIIFTQQFR